MSGRKLSFSNESNDSSFDDDDNGESSPKKMPALTCNCRQRRCMVCHLCIRCSCRCFTKRKNQNPKKRKRVKAGDDDTYIPPSTLDASSLADSDRARGTVARARRTRIGPRVMTQSKGSTRRSGRNKMSNTVSNANGLRSPETIVKNALQQEFDSEAMRQLNTPEVHGIIKAYAKVTDPSAHSIITDTSPQSFQTSQGKSSLDSSVGKAMRSSGDFCDIFEFDKRNFQKKIGPIKERANNSNFSIDHVGPFNNIISAVLHAMDKVCDVLLPGNPETLRRNTIIQGAKRLKIDTAEAASLKRNLGKQLQELYCGMKQRSVPRRTVGAIVEHLKNEGLVTVKLPSGTLKQRRGDLERILQRQGILHAPERNQKVSDEVIIDAVAFILSAENAQFLSWGTKRIKLSASEDYELPNILRRKPKEQLWQEYLNSKTSEEDRKKMLKRTSFMVLASTITSSDKNMVKCVDYVMDNICYNPIERMQSIIDRFFIGDEKDQLTMWLQHVRNFLKVQFGDHVKKIDGDGFHSIGHSITRCDYNDNNQCRVPQCSVCSSQPSTSSRKSHDSYSGGDEAIYMHGKNLEYVVKIASIQKFDSGMERYSVKKVDHGDDGNSDEFKVYRYELRDIPPNNVNCNACKFPFWFCSTLEKKLRDRVKNISEKDDPLSHDKSGAASTSGQEGGGSIGDTNNLEDPNVISQNIDDVISDSEEQQLHTGPLQSSFVTSNKDILLDACRVVRDCRKKFFLYTIHKTRVACQREASDIAEEELKKECMENRCISAALLIIDWKMKFEPMSQAETMTENFGKRGLPWHGVAIIYYIWNDVRREPEKKVFYIDQIVENSSKQDALAVIAMLEATIAAVRANIPGLNKAMICSDNAGCYCSKFLVTMVAVLNAKNAGKFFISKVFHTETQDGKGIVDGHFAVASKHLKKYMKNAKANRTIRILTSKGLALALQWNNGINKSIVQLIELDRERLTAIAKHLKPLHTNMKKYFSRASEIIFHEPNIPEISENVVINHGSTFCSESTDEMLSTLDSVKSKIIVRAHSTYGEGVTFDLNFSTKKAEPHEDGKNEYEKLLGIYQGDHVEESGDGDNEHDANADEQDGDDDSAFDDCSPSQSEGWEEIDTADADFELEFAPSVDDISGLEMEDELLESSDDDEDVSDNDIYVQEPRTYQCPKEDEYKIHDMVTRSNVLKTSYIIRAGTMATIAPTLQKEKRPSKSTHTEPSKQNAVPPRRDVVAVGTRIAADPSQLESKQIQFVQAKESVEEIYKLAKDFELPPTERPYAGYARRDDIVSRDLVGARYLSPEFKESIRQMVQKGNKDKSNKHSAGQMQEVLQGDNPGKFMIPSVYVIQTHINSILSKSNQRKKLKEGDNDDEYEEDVDNEIFGGTAENMIEKEDDGITRWLHERLRVNVNAKPAQIFNELKDTFGIDDSRKKELKTKISSTKAALKAKAWKSIT